MQEMTTGQMGATRLFSLKEAANSLGPEVSVKVLRAEVLAGRLKAVRLRPGTNAKIFVTRAALNQWLNDIAGNRQFVSAAVGKRGKRTQIEQRNEHGQGDP